MWISTSATGQQGSTRASVTLTVCDQSTQAQHESSNYECDVAASSTLLSLKLISLEKLRSRPGYLAGETMVIRAEVRVLL